MRMMLYPLTRTKELKRLEFLLGKWWGPRHVQPILAIHGWQDNAGTFDTLIPLIIEEATSVLCIDLPGHGFSSHRPEGHYYYMFWDGVVTVRRIVKHFDWTNITILGHSLGGAIAFLYAGIYPDEIKKYVAIDIASPTPREPSVVIPHYADQIDAFLSFQDGNGPDYTYEDILSRTVSGYRGSLTEESAKILLKRGASATPKNPNRYTYSRDVRLKTTSLASFTLEKILNFASRIKCDVLNIRSRTGTNLQPSETYNVITNAISQTSKKCLNCVVDGTHHVHLNDPKRVSQIIINFLKQ